MAIETWVTLGPSSAAMASASIRGGKAKTASMIRMRMPSRQPPKNPAMRPIGRAKATEMQHDQGTDVQLDWRAGDDPAEDVAADAVGPEEVEAGRPVVELGTQMRWV